jgi:hypothetical protein
MPHPLPWWALPALAAAVLGIFGGALIFTCFSDDSNLRIVLFTGALNLATMVVGYYFGSSNSSAKKDATIATMQQGKPDA